MFKLLSICNFTLQSFLPFPPSSVECVYWSLFHLMLSKISLSLTKTFFFNQFKSREIKLYKHFTSAEVALLPFAVANIRIHQHLLAPPVIP